MATSTFNGGIEETVDSFEGLCLGEKATKIINTNRINRVKTNLSLYSFDNNIWASQSQDFNNYECSRFQIPNLSVGLESFHGSENHTDKPEAFPGNQSGQNDLDSGYGFFASFSSTNQFSRGQDLNDTTDIWKSNREFSNMSPNQYSYAHRDQFQETGNIENCFSDAYLSDEYHEILSNLWSFGNHGGLESDPLIVMARTPCGSMCLQDILKLSCPAYTQMILKGVLYSIIELMIDDNGKYVFDKLIDACNKEQLTTVMILVENKHESFANAALNTNGGYSIQKLIRKVKKTPHASTITRILSTKFCELMMNRTGMHVILKCLNLFGRKENEVLYHGAIRYCLTMAKNETGCISLNECINIITGVHREVLLNLIANISDHLSHDPYGNFVVQHVLSLRNDEITSRICKRLRGQYVSLALKKLGSHVIEKCVKYSQLGMILAVEEIVSHEKAAFQLARDQFGNYVMQTALKQTKSTNLELYRALVMALKPHFAELMRNTPGKCVLYMIKDDISPQRATATTMN